MLNVGNRRGLLTSGPNHKNELALFGHMTQYGQFFNLMAALRLNIWCAAIDLCPMDPSVLSQQGVRLGKRDRAEFSERPRRRKR